MEIFNYAMEKEKKQEQYYRDLAKKCRDRGLTNILNMLADDEVKHYKILEKMKVNEHQDFSGSAILEQAKNVFGEMKNKASDFSFDISQVDLYRKAQEFEKEAEEDYREKAEKETHEQNKNFFVRLAREERKHYFLLDNIIELLMSPHHWLENAEFFHLEEY